MFRNCARLLKSRGRLILINDSNVLHQETREETLAIWRDREHSWEWVEKLKTWRPIEHAEAKPFAVMREEIVRGANPALSDTSVKAIVENTAGLLKADIQQIAISNYRPGMKFPEVGE